MPDSETNTGCRRCCSYPHGVWSILVSIFALIAFLITNAALGTCYFIWVDDYGYGFLWYENEYFYWSDTYECVAYGDDQKDVLFDAAWKTGRAFAICATVIGFIMMIVSFVFGCVAVKQSTFKVTGFIFVMLAIFNLLMLVGLASDMCPDSNGEGYGSSGCELGPGAILAIVGAVLYGICAGFSFAVGPARDAHPVTTGVVQPAVVAPQQDFTPGAITVTETILPDGTIKKTQTTTNADGSKTIEETITAIPSPQ